MEKNTQTLLEDYVSITRPARTRQDLCSIACLACLGWFVGNCED